MCLICYKDGQAKQAGGYLECQYCKAKIADILPDNIIVQKVLEDHAQSYILGNRDSSDYFTYTKRLDVLKKYSTSAKTVLDFGCGNGNFVKFLISKRYNAVGFDKSKDITNHLKNNNIPFYKNEDEIPNVYFDVITCFDVIEHTTNPAKILETLRTKLKKNGILYITTPNAESISARVLGNKWWVFGPEAHFVLFSLFSLKLFLSNHGFNILDTNTDTLTPWFVPSERLLCRIGNKIVYLALLPFKSMLFARGLGDNIQIIAKLS